MSEMTRKRRGGLLREVFDVVADHPNGIRAADVLATTAKRLEFTEHAQGAHWDLAPAFDRLVRLEMMKAVRAGWMTMDNGTWTATEEGLAARTRYGDPDAFIEAAERLDDERAERVERRFTPVAGEPLDERAHVPVEQPAQRGLAEVARPGVRSSVSASPGHPLAAPTGSASAVQGRSPPLPSDGVADLPEGQQPASESIIPDAPAGRTVEGSAQQTAVETARVRLTLSCLSLASLAVGAIAVAVDEPRLRVACLLLFCLVGIGSAPWQHNVTLRLPARLTLTLVTGFAVLTFVPMTMLAFQSWHPLTALAAVALVCVPFHVAGLRSAMADVRSVPIPLRQELRSSAMTIVLAVAGADWCLAAALTHRHLDPGFYGFLTQIGPLWYAGLALLLAALVLPRGDKELEMALPVVLLLLVLTLTPALVYDGPRSQSAGKHVGLVTQIQTYHALVSTYDIYNNWSGFFASLAWLCDIAGIRDPMKIATFWPPLIAAFRIAALRFLFGQLLATARQCWIAVAVTVLADSLGADYFSPQSVGFLLGLAVFGLALSPYGDSIRLGMILVAGCVLAMSHQLSPYMVGGALVVLVAFRQLRPWWTPLLVIGPAVLWAVAHYKALEGFLSLEAIGSPSNFRPPPTFGTQTLERLPIVRETVLGLLFGIAFTGTLALIGMLRDRRDRRLWAIACCPAVGLVLCAINPYGQEGIFRAVLFALPWLAVLGATWLPAPTRLRGRMAALAGAAALTGAFLVASFGLDATNVVRSADVAADRFFWQQGGVQPATMHFLLPLGTGDLPNSLPILGGGHEYVSRTTLDMPVEQQPQPRPDDEMRRLTAKLLKFSGESLSDAQLFVMWSPVQMTYAWTYAIQTPDQSAGLRDAFVRSPYWRVAFRQNGTVILHFDAARYEAAPA
jgi:hypothetical protein